MRDERTAHGVGPEPEGAASPDRRLSDLELPSVAAGVGGHLARSLKRRRLFIKGTAAMSSAAVAQHYVKPSLQSLGIPAVLAVSGGGDKVKKPKKDK